MSGERSKHSGEVGESLAAAFLEAIGWKTRLSNVSVACNNPAHKNSSGNRKLSHGDDSVFIYNSPFYDDRTEIVHVSVKNNLEGYSESEASLKTTLKDHLSEINEVISCAKYDEAMHGLLSTYPAKKTKNHSGILVWLSSTIGSQYENIIEKTHNVQIREYCEYPVMLVDNARANFILRVIQSAKERTSGDFKFYYPDIGGLTNRRSEHYGGVLPLEHMFSDLIPIKGEIDGKDVLVIYANEDFTLTAYKKIIWLAMAFANAWPRKIFVGFPDYNHAAHYNEAAAAVLAFADRDKEITPFCFFDSLLSKLEN